jgi:hypothetical protein
MNDPNDIYGANLSSLEKLKMLAEWAPLIGRVQAIASASTPHEQALAVVSAVQWAAGKSGTDIDDEALFHLEAVLRSAEGKAFFDWIISKVNG